MFRALIKMANLQLQVPHTDLCVAGSQEGSGAASHTKLGNAWLNSSTASRKWRAALLAFRTHKNKNVVIPKAKPLRC